MADPVGVIARTAVLNSSRTNSHSSTGLAMNRAESERSIENSSKASVDRTIQSIKDFADPNQTSLSFQIQQSTGQIIVKVISDKDGHVIREIPLKEIPGHTAQVKHIEGVLFDRNV